jgi:putative transposase
MHLYKSRQKNVIHYVTTVTHQRTPFFLSENTSELFVRVLDETRKTDPFKLIAYVIMPDHVHLLINPIDLDVRRTINLIKGRSSRLIRQALRDETPGTSASRPTRFWQKGFSSIDIYTYEFVVQKVRYIHMNPVRAGLVKTQAEWKYSSYGVGTPLRTLDSPIEIDERSLWTASEFEEYESKTHP